MSARYQNSDGIVIRRFELPNGDVIATLYGDGGKWRGKVKKGKRLGGNLGKLSLFHDVTVQHYRRNDDDLSIITQVQLNGALPRLSEPGIYPYAHVLAELLDRLTADVHAGEDMFAYFASALRGLSQSQDPEAVALVYAWRLLHQAGLAPRVSGCAVCGNRETGHKFDVAAGGLSCERCDMGIVLSDAVRTDLIQMHTNSVRQVLASPLSERQMHWSLLQRYCAYHVSDLKSIGMARALSAGAGAF